MVALQSPACLAVSGLTVTWLSLWMLASAAPLIVPSPESALRFEVRLSQEAAAPAQGRQTPPKPPFSPADYSSFWESPMPPSRDDRSVRRARPRRPSSVVTSTISPLVPR